MCILYACYGLPLAIKMKDKLSLLLFNQTETHNCYQQNYLKKIHP